MSMSHPLSLYRHIFIYLTRTLVIMARAKYSFRRGKGRSKLLTRTTKSTEMFVLNCITISYNKCKII